MDKWRVIYDGCSMPMIQSPAGRIFRIQTVDRGDWRHSSFEPGDSNMFVKALNLLRETNKELEGLREFKRSVDEALNSGDGSYRP